MTPLLVVVGIRFTDTITLGAFLIAAVIAVPALIALFKAGKWRAEATVNSETAEAYKEGREAFRLRGERLEEEKSRLLVELGDSKARVAELEARPTQETVVQMIEELDKHASRRAETALSVVIEKLESSEQRTIAAFGQQSNRAQDRHEGEMRVLKVILDKVDPGEHTL